jgi:transposase
MKKYLITLTEEERTQLETMLAKGKAAVRKLTHARILLKADSSPGGPSWTDVRISEALEVDVSTVANVRERFVLEGFEVALHGYSTRNHRQRRIDGECEARLIAALCGPAPVGYARWSLRLLADKAVALKIIDEPTSYETVRQVLQANELKPWLKKEWCIPPEQSGEFVCHMEDILEVYHRPLDSKRPLVCMDELPYQLISETRTPLPPRPGQTQCYDYEYKREGVVNIFMVFAPLLGQRWTRVTKRRTYKDWAYLVRDIVDLLFPDAKPVVLVMDNLNTHVGGALYEAFPPDEARRILNKLEIHYTPKHGSWLNMAETELSVLSRQCLDRRIATKQFLEREVCAWNRERNTSAIAVDWQFTTDDARIKLKRLYPVIVASKEDIPLPLGPAVALPPAKPEARRRTKSPRRRSPPVQETAMASSRIASPVIVHDSIM